jgi:hypothetical protein
MMMGLSLGGGVGIFSHDMDNNNWARLYYLFFSAFYICTLCTISFFVYAFLPLLLFVNTDLVVGRR